MAAVLLPSLSFVGIRALSAASSDEATECSGRSEIQVAAAPEIVAPLREVARQVAERKVPVGAKCLHITVTPTRPVDMFAALASAGPAGSGTGGNGGHELAEADLWVPDSWQ